jgi:hypothetical protein
MKSSLMQVIVFVTDDGKSPDGTGPMLYLRDDPASALPPHPRSLAWKYFATVPLQDQLFELERMRVEAALKDGLPFISQRLVG